MTARRGAGALSMHSFVATRGRVRQGTLLSLLRQTRALHVRLYLAAYLSSSSGVHQAVGVGPGDSQHLSQLIGVQRQGQLFQGCKCRFHIAVPFRNRERITFDHLASMKKPNETALIRVLRDGKENEFSITLQPVSHSDIFSFRFMSQLWLYDTIYL